MSVRFGTLVDQRADRVPLQHLTGRAPFRYLELAVGPGRLRAAAGDRAAHRLGAGAAGRARTRPSSSTWAAGSGAIALSLAHEHPGARVTAVERDPGAIEWTRHNAAARADAGDTAVTVLEGDMTDPALLPELDGAVDLVVSNPPYVPDGARVPREVADHDPPLALWGGPDGLDVVRGLLVTAARLLRPAGWLGIEHADQQGTCAAGAGARARRLRRRRRPPRPRRPAPLHHRPPPLSRPWGRLLPRG